MSTSHVIRTKDAQPLKKASSPVRKISHLPEFPDFKPLTLEDKAVIEEYTSTFPPYSDFNFVSLWIWNNDKHTYVSILNNNLVISLKDYTNDKRIISFLGTNMTEKTLQTIIAYYKNDPNILIKFLPEINFIQSKNILKNDYIALDRDQFDYIYSTKELTFLSGEKYHKKRNLCNNFSRTYSFEVKILDLRDPSVEEEILQVNELWKKRKIEDEKEYDGNELATIRNLFSLNDFRNILGIGIYMANSLAGFTISELLPNKTSILHLQKMDISYIGLAQMLVNQTAKILLSKGYHYINMEQDLGILGLRQSKERWRPIWFLRKYSLNPTCIQ